MSDFWMTLAYIGISILSFLLFYALPLGVVFAGLMLLRNKPEKRVLGWILLGLGAVYWVVFILWQTGFLRIPFLE